MHIQKVETRAYTNNSALLPAKQTALSQRQSLPFDSVNFKSNFVPTSVRDIQLYLLHEKGITADFHNRQFIANCTYKIINVFSELFKDSSDTFREYNSYLPKEIHYRPIMVGAMGQYTPFEDMVIFNSDSWAFKNPFNLKLSSLSGWNLFRPNSHSSMHSAHVFAHEFGHAAHWHNLEKVQGEEKAEKVWMDLEGYMVPDPVGRLIIKYKLGNYAVDSMDMCEFMAERVSQDVCNSLKGSDWKIGKKPDVGYSDIFERKWDYRYTNAQSYLDYFTQQVWNGDLREAIIAADMIDDFLKMEEEERAVRLPQSLAKIVELKEIKTKLDIHPLIYKIADLYDETVEKLENTMDELRNMKKSVSEQTSSVKKTEESSHKTTIRTEETQTQQQTNPAPTTSTQETTKKKSIGGILIKIAGEILTEELDNKNRIILKL